MGEGAPITRGWRGGVLVGQLQHNLELQISEETAHHIEERLARERAIGEPPDALRVHLTFVDRSRPYGPSRLGGPPASPMHRPKHPPMHGIIADASATRLARSIADASKRRPIYQECKRSGCTLVVVVIVNPIVLIYG